MPASLQHASPQPPTPSPSSSAPSSPLPSGRPRTLDETKRSEICALVTNGCSLKDAARYVGCHVATVRREARRDPEFSKRLRHAARKSELVPLNAIREAAKRSWRAGAYLMERADAERHAAKNARRVTITQLKNFNASLVRILKIRMGDRMACNQLARLFDEVLNYCVHQIAAGRDPFPIPPQVTRNDCWLPAPPRAAADSPETPTSQQPAPPPPTGANQANGISWFAGTPVLTTSPNNQPRY
jgi:hypothetical protein